MGQFLDIDVLNYSIKSLSKMIDITFLKKKQLFDVTPESYRLFDSVTDDPNDKLTVVANNVAPITGQVTSDTVRAVTKNPAVYQVGAEVIHIDEVLVPKFDHIKGVTTSDLTAIKADTKDNRYAKYDSNVLFIVDNASMEFYNRATDKFTSISSGGTSGSGILYWQSLKDYKEKDVVLYQYPDRYGVDEYNKPVLEKTYLPSIYVCIKNHTSSTSFENDLNDNWVTIDGTNFESYTQDELKAMLGLTSDQLHTLQSLIDDANITTNHCWSSSAIYTKLLDTLQQAKDYTDNTLANSTKIEKEVVATLPAVADANPNVMYLIKDTTVTTNDIYLQYMLIGGSFVSLGKTGGEFPIKIYDSAKAYAKDDLVLAKVGSSITYNIFRCTNPSGVLANAVWSDTDWEVTNGSKLKVEANANNTSSDYRLDITQPDGTVFTTDNLHGIDGVMVQDAGMFGIRVENGQLMLYVNVSDSSSTDVDDQAPPFSIENNCLMYTVGGTIQYVSKQVIS